MLMRRSTASVISYAGCLVLSPVYLDKIHSLNVRRSLKMRRIHQEPEIAKKITKTLYFWSSWSFKVIDVGTPGKVVSSAYYDTGSLCLSATVLIVHSSRNRAF